MIVRKKGFLSIHREFRFFINLYKHSTQYELELKSISPQSNIYSSAARLKFQTGPAPVRSLFDLERGSDYIRLGWEEVPNAVEYAIYYYAKACLQVFLVGTRSIHAPYTDTYEKDLKTL